MKHNGTITASQTYKKNLLQKVNILFYFIRYTGRHISARVRSHAHANARTHMHAHAHAHATKAITVPASIFHQPSPLSVS